MLTARQVLDEYFLNNRSMLLEIAATLDRLDAADDGPRDSAGADLRLGKIYTSLAILADRNAATHPEGSRAERLLVLFSDPVD